jgi:hypothetical protein
VHAGCGHPVSVGYYCPDCRAGVRSADVAVKRGGRAPRPTGVKRGATA